MKKIIAVMLAGLVLAGCEQREVFDERKLTMTVSAVVLRSKHNSKVTLIDDATGRVYSGERLRCNRSSARDVVIGKKWVVTEITYVYPESKRYTSELVGVRAICENS